MTADHRVHDRYGLELSSSSADAVAHYVAGVDRLLALDAGAEECFAAASAADAGFALAHAALAVALQGRGLGAEAKQAASQAASLAGGASRREQQHVASIAAAVKGESAAALALCEEHLDEFPRDVLVFRQAGALIGTSGRRDRLEESLALHERLAPHYGDDWYALSASTMILQEFERYDEARRNAERALQLWPRSGGAAHGLSHVFYETNGHAEGSQFLGGWMPAYDPLAPMHCHLAWHWALFELAAGHWRRVLALYDRAIQPAVTQSRTSMYDAASLLWREQIYGSTEEPRPWADVCAVASRLCARPGAVFNDVHAAMAFAAAGDDVALARLADGLSALDEGGHQTAGLALTLLRAVDAFAHGAYADTVRLMEPVAGEIVRVGGSHTQREVFEDTLIEACLRSGAFDRAEAVLRKRLSRRPSARDFFWLGQAQLGRQDNGSAASSLAKARERWRDAEPGFAELQRVQSAEQTLLTQQSSKERS